MVRIRSLWVALACCSLMIAACSGQPDPAAEATSEDVEQSGVDTEETEDSPDAAAPDENDEAAADGDADGGVQNLSAASAGVGSAAYSQVASLAEYINTQSGVDSFTLTAQATAGNVENLRLLVNGEVDFTHTSMAPLWEAQNGVGAFAEDDSEPFQNVLLLSPIWTAPYQWVTYDDDIETLRDLAGKTVNLGPPGSAPLITAEQSLRAAGVWEEVDVSMEPPAEGARLMQDGLVDAFMWLGSPPVPAIVEAAAQGDLKLIEVPQDVIDYEVENIPGVSELVVPAGVYGDDLPETDYVTSGWLSFYSTLSDTPRDVVWDMMSVLTDPDAHAWLIEQNEAFNTVLGEGFEPHFDAVEQVGAKMHPVAVEYWEDELGVEVPETVK